MWLIRANLQPLIDGQSALFIHIWKCKQKEVIQYFVYSEWSFLTLKSVKISLRSEIILTHPVCIFKPAFSESKSEHYIHTYKTNLAKS